MRLTDIDELKKSLHNFFDGKVIDEPAYILRDVFYFIDNAPTVSIANDRPQFIIKVNNAIKAQTIADELKRIEPLGVILPNECEIERLERPHGEWIMQPKFCRRACSHCKKAFRTSFAPANFCPNCGAQMTDKGGRGK